MTPSDPDMAVLLDKLNDWDAAAGPQTTIEGARKRIEEMRALYFEPELLQAREVENVTVPGLPAASPPGSTGRTRRSRLCRPSCTCTAAAG